MLSMASVTCFALLNATNSPDKLDVVYFHLYQNAFQPESYLDELQKQNRKSTIYGQYEKQNLGTMMLVVL